VKWSLAEIALAVALAIALGINGVTLRKWDVEQTALLGACFSMIALDVSVRLFTRRAEDRSPWFDAPNAGYAGQVPMWCVGLGLGAMFLVIFYMAP